MKCQFRPAAVHKQAVFGSRLLYIKLLVMNCALLGCY